MLTRQKIILSLLDNVKRPVKRLVLVKWAFLLRQTALSGHEGAFYDFVPYKYGPFSFALYRDLNALERDGYILNQDEAVVLKPGALVSIHQRIEELPDKLYWATAAVTEQYSQIGQRDLVRRIYQEYPWYAMNSELTELLPENTPAPPPVEFAVYTIGYQGKTVDMLFKQLLLKGIRCLIDVRANPISRQYGFAKKSLSEIAGKLGLEYQHWPELGIPARLRTQLCDFASYQRLLGRYEAEILPENETQINSLAEFLKQKPSALLCLEKDIRCCHRSRLAGHLSKINGLPVIHL